MLINLGRTTPKTTPALLRWRAVVLCFALIASGMLHIGSTQAAGQVESVPAITALEIAAPSLDSCSGGGMHGPGEACCVHTASCTAYAPVEQIGFLVPLINGSTVHQVIEIYRGTSAALNAPPPKLAVQA